MTVSLEDVRAAQVRLAGQVAATPCLRSRTLSEITGAELWLKFENLQYTASFKERGALNRLAQLTPEQAAVGVVAGHGEPRERGRRRLRERGLQLGHPAGAGGRPGGAAGERRERQRRFARI